MPATMPSLQTAPLRLVTLEKLISGGV
jgi:hypothetical protein